MYIAKTILWSIILSAYSTKLTIFQIQNRAVVFNDFGDEPFHAIDCTGTNNQTSKNQETKQYTQYTSGTQKTNSKNCPSLQNKLRPGFVHLWRSPARKQTGS